MSECELHETLTRRSDHAALEMKRRVVVREPARLRVQEERVLHVLEAHLLFEGERLRRWVVALSLASPGSEQKGNRQDVRMKIGVRVDGHQPTLPRCDSGSGPRDNDDPSGRVPSSMCRPSLAFASLR